jgi:AhpD family alkylhydroperoxidase
MNVVMAERIMSKDEIFSEIESELGTVPGFFRQMPEDSLDAEWQLFKKYVLYPETEIPPKYRELIGIASAAARHCWYCTNFHTGLAKHHGASDAEIEEAVYLSKFGGGWSTYLNGINYDKETFLKELHKVGEYLSRK